VPAARLIGEAYLDLEVDFTVYLYAVEFLQNAIPLPQDHDELRWVSLKHAIEYMPCSPAMYIHYPHVRRYLWEHHKREP